MVNEENKKYKIIAITAIILGILIICLALYFYFSKADRKDSGKDYSIGDLTQEVKNSEAEGRNLIEELQLISKSYKDAVVWLKVPGTSIDTPVFQATDNDRFLRNDRNGKKTRWGENFLDYTCDINKIGDIMQHYIIYGHNTEVDTRFTPLLNYKNKEFYKTHKEIEFATTKAKYKFEIFSAYKTTTDFYYIETEFENEDEYSNFLTSIKEKSEYDTGIEVAKDDTILTLSTCDYSIDDGRYVVHARLVK